MQHYFKTKKEMLKEISWWVKNLRKDTKLSIEIEEEPTLKNFYKINLSEENKLQGDENE